MLSGHHRRSPITNRLFRPASIGGIIALLSALFLFIKNQGVHEIIYWTCSGCAFSVITIYFLTGSRDGLRPVFGLMAPIMGGYFPIARFNEVDQSASLASRCRRPPSPLASYATRRRYTASHRTGGRHRPLCRDRALTRSPTRSPRSRLARAPMRSNVAHSSPQPSRRRAVGSA
jgi:hypothetical protein